MKGPAILRPALAAVLALAAFLGGYYGPGLTLSGRSVPAAAPHAASAAGTPAAAAAPAPGPDGAGPAAAEPPASPAPRWAPGALAAAAADDGAGVQPQPPVPRGARVPVPVLMYHAIAPGPNNLYVPPDEFAAHLEYLEREGYTAVTLRRMYEHFTAGAPLPPRPVVLTFDDGYADFYTTAYPLLKKHHFPATLFVITGSVGRPGYVTWDQVREMARGGIEMGAHSVNHPNLTFLDAIRLQAELAGSRRALAQAAGQPVHFFAYPSGRQNERVVAAARAAGYLGAVTTAYGPATPAQEPLLWRRVRINQKVSPPALGAQLRAAAARPNPS